MDFSCIIKIKLHFTTSVEKDKDKTEAVLSNNARAETVPTGLTRTVCQVLYRNIVIIKH